MPNRDNEGRILIPQAGSALDALKFEVAQEIGWAPGNLRDLQQKIDQAKYEIAAELQIPLTPGYNGDLPSKMAGAVGGRLGGRLGGQMVKRMIALAESQLAGGTAATGAPVSPPGAYDPLRALGGDLPYPR